MKEKPHLYRGDGTRRAVNRRDVDDLLAMLHERDDPAALFLKSLSDAELDRYAMLIAEPRPELGLPAAPDLTSAPVEGVGDWLHAVWSREEDGFDDEACPTMPFQEWLAHAAEDSFYRHHLHSRFYLAMSEPELDLPEP